MLVGLGPAGLGLLTAAYVRGMLPALADAGMLVVDAESAPGGGDLLNYGVRSDSAATVFLEVCRATGRNGPRAAAAELRHIGELPPFESADLTLVGGLLRAAGQALVDVARGCGVCIETSTTVTAVEPATEGGAVVTITGRTGTRQVQVNQLFLAPGGEPFVPESYCRTGVGAMCHSDVLLRKETFEDTFVRLPAHPSVLVIGRAHSAFSVADRLLSDPRSTGWRRGAVMLATRGPVRVTYQSLDEAMADGLHPDPTDVCPNTGRVFRLSGLRGDGARRYQLARDGADPRLIVQEMTESETLAAARRADLVVAATGSDPLRALCSPLAVGSSRMAVSWVETGVRSPASGPRALGSGWRRSAGMGGEASYAGPIDGVWHYQSVVAPALLSAAWPLGRLTRSPPECCRVLVGE